MTKTSSIVYDLGGMDDALPHRNAIEIREFNDETEEELYLTTDLEIIAQLFEWNDAVNAAAAPVDVASDQT